MLIENIIRFFKRIFKSKSVPKISSEDVDISNSNQVRKVEEVTENTESKKFIEYKKENFFKVILRKIFSIFKK